MFKSLIGDLFASRAQTLVNAVNCVGVMGKGIALEFKTRFPAMFDDYAARCRRGAVRLGEPYPFRDVSGAMIINFPTKGHWRTPSRLADIAKGLDYFAQHAHEWGVTSAAFPALGCGNGGLAWREVGPMIYQKLLRLELEIELQAPPSTPPAQLTTEFLARHSVGGRQAGCADEVSRPKAWLK
jgi:O-acetyl-ADP-ribose deacetylase (regulator of RNase III)